MTVTLPNGKKITGTASTLNEIAYYVAWAKDGLKSAGYTASANVANEIFLSLTDAVEDSGYYNC